MIWRPAPALNAKIMIGLKNNKGQSLVELIVAIAVIEIGIFSVWSLFLVNFNAEREAEMRIVGVNLAREGVEVIKNIRDSNWLKNNSNTLTVPEGKIWPWDENLAAGDYAVNFDSAAPVSADYRQLYLDDDGFYSNLEGGKKTPYSRKITLNNICCSDGDENLKCDSAVYSITDTFGICALRIGINIVSEVAWQISGNDRHVIVEDNIYNWK